MNCAHVHSDAGIAAHSRPAPGTRHPNWLLTTTILASSLAFIDGSVVNIGLPALGATFKAGAGDLQWVINAYLLPLSALLLLGGAAGDRYGHGRLLVLGTALFGAASIGCALAPTLVWLLVGRGLQGIGAALLMPNSLAILGARFSGEARGRAIGIWASVGAVMGACGPVLGGWLIDTVGWRSIFLINLPVAAGAVVLALIFVRDARREDQAAPLDLLGGVLATASLGGLTWGLTIGSGHAGWTPSALLLLFAGVALMLGFLGVERSKSEAAMMPLALFGSSSFIGLTVLTLLLYGALGALIVLVPYVLIQAGGYSGAQAGAALLPFAAVLALASPVMGAVAGRIGPRVPLTIGPLVVAGGFLLILRIGPHADYWTTVFPAMLVIAIGMAGAVAPLTTAVFASVDSRHSGSASGLNSAVARTGGMVATALLGAALGAAGPALLGGFHAAAEVCALASVGASASAFFLIAGGGGAQMNGRTNEVRTRRGGQSSSTTVVYVALLGNILVALSKAGAAFWTGSAAMTSEAIHSAVDTTNEILLLYGIRRARQRADVDHPFGYGREVYFWSFVVSLLIFALGAVVSIYDGVYRMLYPVPIRSPMVSYIVLALVFLFEGVSWLYSFRQFRQAKGNLGFLEAFTLSKDPPAFMTLFEDSVALLGVFIAAAATFAAVSLGHPEFDGAGSIAIGLILAATSLFLARESKSLLIGEQAYPSIRRSILSLANAQPNCLRANGLITAQLGPNQVVAMLSLEFSDAMLAPQIEEAVIDLETKVREANPEIVALFVKPQTAKTFQDQRNRLLGQPEP